MNWKKYITPAVVVMIIIGLSGWIGKSICKTIDKNEVGIEHLEKAKADRKAFDLLVGNFKIYKLEQYRKYLQERIWQIQRGYPQTYASMPEYKRLVIELKSIDLQISAYYRK